MINKGKIIEFSLKIEIFFPHSNFITVLLDHMCMSRFLHHYFSESLSYWFSH